MLIKDNDQDVVAELLLEAESILRAAREQNLYGSGIYIQTNEIKDGERCLNCGRPIVDSVVKNLCIYCYEEWD